MFGNNVFLIFPYFPQFHKYPTAFLWQLIMLALEILVLNLECREGLTIFHILCTDWLEAPHNPPSYFAKGLQFHQEFALSRRSGICCSGRFGAYLWQIPVVQRDNGRDLVLQQHVNQVVIIFDPSLVDLFVCRRGNY